MVTETIDALEGILEKIGKWGKFQFFYYLCLGFVVVYSVFTMNYIFVARDIKYRCFIAECDTSPENTLPYNPPWLRNFVPYKDAFPSRCLRYITATLHINDENFTKCKNINYEEKLQHFAFNLKFNGTQKCDKFVFERKEITIVHDFQMTCDENLWKLTIVGTINVVGELVSLSYSGFLSDRYGRKTIMTICVFLSCICGLCKSFATNYYMFIVLEFLDTALGGAMYGAAFVLAMELVTTRDRNFGNTAISCVFAFGQIIFGCVAWLTPNWRMLLRILYVPGLMSIFLYFFLPESIRWLLSRHKTNEATKILTKIAQINGRQLDIDDILTIERLFKPNRTSLDETDVLENQVENQVENADNGKSSSFLGVLKNPVLLVRTIHCSLTWVCCTFVFYGLTIHSVDLSKNIYMSFIFAAVAETPGYVIYYYANERSGRRKMMSSTLVLGGVFCLSVGFLPEGWFKLIAFFCGKCCLTIAYTVLYVYTTELFPTCSRHAMFSICSMFGRIGSMVAPQIPLLARLYLPLPLFLFSGMSLLFGFLALLFPETAHIPLPHTIEDALNIGKRISISEHADESYTDKFL